MSTPRTTAARRALVAVALAATAAVAAPAQAPARAPVRFERLAGVAAPGTPQRYDRVGILEVGPRRAPNILVLNPGTSASAAYFVPLAGTIEVASG